MISGQKAVTAKAELAKKLAKLHLACFAGHCIELDMVLQVNDLKLPQAPTGAPALAAAPAFVVTEALLPHDPRKAQKGPALQPPPALSQGDTTVQLLNLSPA